MRLALIGSVGPGDDEAYYWDWSRQLDWSYFDHPPMVAWLIGASTGLLGDSVFAVRLPFTLLAIVGGGLVLVLSRELWPTRPRLAGLSMVSFHCMPVLALAAVFAAPDMPMLVAWLGLTLAGLRAHRRARTSDWLLTGALGGALLLSKYTGLLAILGLLGWLASIPRGRRQLASPGPWLGAGLSILIFSPVLFWNAQHDWASFAFHLVGRHGHDVAVLSQGATFLGSQLLAASPLLAVACVAGLLRPGRIAPKLHRLIAWQALPVLLLFGLTSPFTQFKAHWIAPGWTLLLGLGLAWLLSLGRPRLWTGLALGAAVALSIVIQLQALYPVLSIPSRDDPTNDLVGWPEVAQELETRCVDLADCKVVSHMYQLAAQAAFVLPERSILRLGDRRDQYTIWQGAEQSPWQGVWVSHDRYFFDPMESEIDLNCTPDGELPILREGREVRRFFFWRCSSR
jgi:4-amino-4-deoxy-L-arabinose transferase-like glycosyltransferase